MLNKLITKLRGNRSFLKILEICLILSLGFYIFSIPSFSARSGYNLVSYGLMFLSALFVVLSLIFRKNTIRFRWFLLLPFCFSAEALIGTVIWSHDFRHWLTILLLAFTTLVFYFAFCSIDNHDLIIKIIAYPLLAFSIYFAYHYRTDILSLNANKVLGGFFDNVNAIGTYFSVGSALFLYLALHRIKPINFLYLLPCVVMIFLGLFTGSRHFIITTGFTIAVTSIVSLEKRKWVAIIVIASLIVSFILVIRLPFLANLKERIERGVATLLGTGAAKFDPSAVQRTVWPYYGINLALKNMLFGYGAEGFSIYSGIGTYSHNTYSEIICNYGAFGAIIFYSMFLYPLLLAVRSRTNNVRIVFVVVSFYFIKGFFGVYFAAKDAYLMIALLAFLTKDLKLGEFYNSFFRKEHYSTDYIEVNI